MDERKVKTPPSEPQSATGNKPESPPAAGKPEQPSTAAPKSEPQSAAQPQVKVEVAEREPLSVVVVDTPAAEPAVLPETRVRVPVRVPVRTEPYVEEPPEAPTFPYAYWLLAAAALVMLLLAFKNIYQPLMVHVEDSVERLVLGEPSKIWQAPQSDPHTKQQKPKSSVKW
jgi:hypothetical protein